MRLHRFAAALSVALLPAVAFGMAMCERGNKPRADNYRAWPGLINVVNDLSRESWCWVNGYEWMSYRGDTAVLNRVLKEFGEVEAEELRVAIVPGPGRIALLSIKHAEQSKDRGDDTDWELTVVQGVVRAHVQHEGTESIYDMHPTLTIYLTDRIDLNTLQIPERIKVLQHADLRQRLVNGIDVGNDKVRARAKQFLEKFDANTPQTGEEAEEFKSRLAKIDAFVQKHKASADQ